MLKKYFKNSDYASLGTVFLSKLRHQRYTVNVFSITKVY